MINVLAGILGLLGWVGGALVITEAIVSNMVNKTGIHWNQIAIGAILEWSGFFAFSLTVHWIVITTS